MHELNLSPDIARWVVQALARWWGTVAIAVGMLIILGGEERWSSPSFAAALLVPGAPASWGLVVATFGALTLVGSFTPRLKVTAAGLFGVAVWCLFFAGAMLKTALDNPGAASTGAAVYTGVAVTTLVLCAAYWRSRDA